MPAWHTGCSASVRHLSFAVSVLGPGPAGDLVARSPPPAGVMHRYCYLVRVESLTMHIFLEKEQTGPRGALTGAASASPSLSPLARCSLHSEASQKNWDWGGESSHSPSLPSEPILETQGSAGLCSLGPLLLLHWDACHKDWTEKGKQGHSPFRQFSACTPWTNFLNRSVLSAPRAIGSSLPDLHCKIRTNLVS